MISADIWKELDKSIYRIYSAENDRQLRNMFLKDIRHIVAYQAAFFDLKTIYRGKTFYYDPISINFSQKALDAYYEKYVEKDYTSWVLTQPDLYLLYRDSDLIPKVTQERSVLYTEWLKPMNLSYGCGMIIAYQDTIYGTATFARETTDKDFSDEDLQILNILVKHLCLKFYQLYPSGIMYKKPISQQEAFKDYYHLTTRENEICQLVYNGLSTAEIAATLCISVSTVSRHIANIYQKLKINTRYALIQEMSRFMGTIR